VEWQEGAFAVLYIILNLALYLIYVLVPFWFIVVPALWLCARSAETRSRRRMWMAVTFVYVLLTTWFYAGGPLDDSTAVAVGPITAALAVTAIALTTRTRSVAHRPQPPSAQ
jgi:hypothetical protein